MDSLIGLGSPVLNEEEQRRLIAIAMNPGPSTGGLGSNINLNFSGLAPGMPMTFGAGLGSGSSPKPVSPPQRSAALPRPAAPYPPKKHGSVSEKGKEKLKPGERTAHNDIERKYRTNLKDKIAELRDAVPALRTVSEEGDEDDGTQPSRTAKVSKVRLVAGLESGEWIVNQRIGYRSHQSNRVHTPTGAAQQADRAAAPGALAQAAGV